MMNHMGQGAGASVIGGIRIADWALAITYLLIGLLALIALVAILRTLAALWRGRPARRRRARPMGPPAPGEGTPT